MSCRCKMKLRNPPNAIVKEASKLKDKLFCNDLYETVIAIVCMDMVWVHMQIALICILMDYFHYNIEYNKLKWYDKI